MLEMFLKNGKNSFVLKFPVRCLLVVVKLHMTSFRN